MNVKELSRDQIEELKQEYLTRKMDENGETPSYEELALADQTISDDEIFEEYAGTEFSPDDFVSGGEETEPPADETVTAWIAELSPGEYLHINNIEDGNGTWFDCTKSIWEAYWVKNFEDLRFTVETEFSDFAPNFPKYHQICFSHKYITTEN